MVRVLGLGVRYEGPIGLGVYGEGPRLRRVVSVGLGLNVYIIIFSLQNKVIQF